MYRDIDASTGDEIWRERLAAIEVRHLTKRFGSLTAVSDLSFDVEPGGVTGFSRAERGGQARYGIVTYGPIPRYAPGKNHPTPVRVMRGREFRYTAEEPATGLPFGQGPAGTLPASIDSKYQLSDPIPRVAR